MIVTARITKRAISQEAYVVSCVPLNILTLIVP